MSQALLRQDPDWPRPLHFTAQAYVEARGTINRLWPKTELRDGVILEMPADGPLTKKWNNVLARWLHTSLDERYIITADKSLLASDDWVPTPDLYVQPADIDEFAVRARDTLLLIEVADTTIGDDLGEKARRYARAGVREYWVVDPQARCVHVHRLGEGAADGYGPARVVAFDEAVSAQLIPGLTLKLSDLPRIS
jgi:Uma2 family endonuclease